MVYGEWYSLGAAGFFKESSKGALTEKEKGFFSCPPPVDSAMTIGGGVIKFKQNYRKLYIDLNFTPGGGFLFLLF